MKTIFIYLTFICFIVYNNNVSAQTYYSPPTPIDSTQFANNKDWLKAHQLQFTAPIDTVKNYYHKAIKALEKENNWEAYLKVATELLRTFNDGNESDEAQSFGKIVLEKLQKYKPRLQRKSGELIYNIGLSFPYPYKNQQPLDYFDKAISMVKNQLEPDTLLLGKIFGSAGMSHLQLEHFEKAWEHLQQAKYLLESQISEYENCSEAWENIDFSTDGFSIIDSTIHEDGSISWTAVSSNPPEWSIGSDCGHFYIPLADVYSNLGKLHRIKGDYETSVHLLDRAIAFSKVAGANSPEYLALPYYYQIGLYYHNQEEYEHSNIFFKKILNLLNDGFFDRNRNEEYEVLKVRKNFHRNELMPNCYYYLGKNILALNYYTYDRDRRLALYDTTEVYLKKALSLTYDYQHNLKVKILSGLGELHYYRDPYYTNDFSEIKNYYNLTDEIIKNENILLETKANYFLNKAFVFGWLINEPKLSFELLQQNLSLLPSNLFPALRIKSILLTSELYFAHGIILGETHVDSAVHYTHQALLELNPGFFTLNHHWFPNAKDLLEHPVVQKVFEKKVFFTLKQIGIQEFSEVREEAKDFFGNNTISEDSPFYEEFTSIKVQLRSLINIVNLADEFLNQQIKRANIVRGGKLRNLIRSSFETYRYGIQAVYFLNLFSKEEQIRERGFYFTQKMKGQKVLLAELKNEALLVADVDKKLLEVEERIQNSIINSDTWLHSLKQKDQLSDIESQSIEIEQDQLFEAQFELQKLQREIDLQHPEFLEKRLETSFETYRSVQQLLEDDEILIEYVLTCCEFFVLAIIKDQPIQIIEAPAKGSTTYNILHIKKLLETSTLSRPSSRKKFINMSHELYGQFITPIEELIADKKRLIIIPDQFAHYVPFEILLKSNEEKPHHKLNYLIKDFEISYHYSSTLLARARRKSIQGDGSVYAFAPVYNDVTDNIDIASLNPSIDDLTLRAIDNNGFFAPLPYSEKEVNSIFKLFNKKNKKSNNTLAIRSNAKEQDLKNNLVKPYQFIHIAAHSFANLLNPNFSGIACYQKNEWIDGILFSNEINGLKTQADLITLSSCESGGGQVDETEGILGLNRAFILSGTPNVVFSLWKVYDKVNAKLMVDFYKNIISGNDYSESLRKAKLKLLKKESTASPHFWAPYLLIGR